MSSSPKRKLLLIGWDAADWKVIQPLVDAGWMPNLSRLIERGTMGNLATIQPILSPMLWSSIATGKRPYKHGVLGFSEVIPETGDIRPVSSLSRKSKAVWNILHQEGKKCHVVGWWPSHPVEKLRGGMVSNHYHVATADLDNPWPMMPGTIHPPEQQEALAALRIHPHELEGEMLRSFVPRAPEIDQKKDKRLATLAKLVAECSSIHAAATHLLSSDPDWDFAAVYYDAIDHFSHAFMRYHPPKLDWVTQEDFDLYSQVLGGAYVYHDTMLGTLLSLAGEESTVILISDHGFHPDNLRPQHLPNEPAGPAAEHRSYGIFVAAGPGIREDALLHSASILDVAPTILSLFDLPIGRDMDGRVLGTITKNEPSVSYIDSWDAVEGDAAMNAGGGIDDSHSSAAVLKQLADLGYIDALPEDRQEGIDQTVREERYNLARALDDGGRHDEAAALFAELWERWPEESRFGVHLIQIQIKLERPLEARATMTLLKERKKTAVEKASHELREMIGTLRAEQGLPEEMPEEAAGKDETELDWEKVPEPKLMKFRRLQALAGTNRQSFAFLEGSLLAAEGLWSEALEALEKVSGIQSSQVPTLHLKRGDVLMAMRRPADAALEYEKTLELDPVNPSARFGLARVALFQRDFSRAADEARAAIGCRYEFPQAHLIAGIALWRSGDPEAAEAYLRLAVAINPVFPAGQRTLASFLQNEKRDPASAREHRHLAMESRRRLREWKAGIRPEGEHPMEYRRAFGSPPELQELKPFLTPASECVVIVSGLPRSGTSMMMQMIQAGGFPILADDKRLPDESNPRGYLEFEPAKKLLSDQSWIESAKGSAVTLLSPLLPHLPRSSGIKYKIILMLRPVGEVVASQRAMLARDGKEGSPISDESLAEIYQRQIVTTRTLLSHLQRHGEAEVMEVSYHSSLEDPCALAKRLRAFLGADFDEEKAIRVVDPSLYRSRPTPVSSRGGVV